MEAAALAQTFQLPSTSLAYPGCQPWLKRLGQSLRVVTVAVKQQILDQKPQKGQGWGGWGNLWSHHHCIPRAQSRDTQ